MFRKKFKNDGVKSVLKKRLSYHWLRETDLTHANIALVREDGDGSRRFSEEGRTCAWVERKYEGVWYARVRCVRVGVRGTRLDSKGVDKIVIVHPSIKCPKLSVIVGGSRR